MKGKPILLLFAFLLSILLYFFNSNSILRSIQKINELEGTLKAEKNIREELIIEHDNLISDKHISKMVEGKLYKYLPQHAKGTIVYIQEPPPQQDQGYYSIIDLFNSEAEAKNPEHLD